MQEKDNLKSKITSGLAWKTLELAGTQGIQFIVSLILARILTPDEFGTVSLIAIFITIANVFVQSGFATSLVQNKDLRDSDYSSVLWVSLILAVLMYALLYFSAPAIAKFYESGILTKLIRVTALVLFPGAVVSIQTAYVSVHMEFKKLFIGSLIAVIISGTAAIVLAINGAGVWAMIWQQLIFYGVLMISMFFIISWKPKFIIVMDRVKVLWNFGWKILVAGLIDTIWHNVYGLVIGKKYSSAQLGGYEKADQFPRIISSNLSSALQSVMLPAYSKVQDEKERLKALLQSTIKYSAFLMFPMMAGLAVVAEPLISVLLTDKWLFAAPYLRILALTYMLWPVHTANLQSINAQGGSDKFLKLEIIKKICGIIVLIISIRFNLIIMLWFKLINEFTCAVINSTPNGKTLGYGFFAQMKDLIPCAVCTAVMSVCVWFAGRINTGNMLKLVIQIIVGIIVYAATSYIFNRQIFKGILRIRRR